jgi:hypothetical protein
MRKSARVQEEKEGQVKSSQVGSEIRTRVCCIFWLMAFPQSVIHSEAGVCVWLHVWLRVSMIYRVEIESFG